ncbi:chromate transporter [Chengkuizengella axinellae]|uniref:Chromate transporter n=1 Tax=Chengkuizengella axinellae TaxID=3064388 RepID=A0ABT9IZS0_9BACL|nr:chromate transporter [Chengkuizengella sp. 2205SS18-9]MDP5274820.1 chromate transporter [Chengkuizengella sp. 2205SS18-9]
MFFHSNKMKLIAQIFITFLKIGPVTFGGGYAMIPLIEREVVERRKWVKTQDITDIFAVAESVPGAIAINTATFIGYRLAGIPGAIAAMAGVMLPTFMIVIVLSIFFLRVQNHPKVEAAFIAIRATIVALITYAAIKIGKISIIDKSTVVLAILTVVTMYFVHIHPIALILFGGIIGIGIILIKQKRGKRIHFEKEEQQRYKYTDYYIGDGI